MLNKYSTPGLQYLQRHIAAGTMHDSTEHYPPPQCCPETHRVINCEIRDWIENTNRLTKILWLNGLAGAGKLAIVQTIAELYSSLGKNLESDSSEIWMPEKKLNGVLGASFFSCSTPGRNSLKHLIPTIAAQLVESIPQIAAYIEAVIGHNSSILNKSVDIQLRKLISKPLQSLLAHKNHLNFQSTFIIIDGLDECLGEDNQILIMKLITSAIIEEQIPLCFLICSHPESWIKDTFDLSPLNKITH
ncbi:hypothetical protein BDQ12DRAFT_614028 [Crucibulum laeve]|uniref:Nephrocystin 3-like N-terminal domain-containing protein n=1 Tax=Crucibulum laeve TaxID=68775 RepID=A0A5C3LLP8_9AGAR|nr:hypothetical protein BDQ12DRAFT_614028 [Crucibulum laeve]